MTGDQLTRLFRTLCATVLAIGMVGYAILLAGAFVISEPARPLWLQSFREAVMRSPEHTVGLPISAVAAFGLVTLLQVRYGGDVSFKAFGLEFNGPGGPVTLWLLCYLSFVGSMCMVGSQ